MFDSLMSFNFRDLINKFSSCIFLAPTFLPPKAVIAVEISLY